MRRSMLLAAGCAALALTLLVILPRRPAPPQPPTATQAPPNRLASSSATSAPARPPAAAPTVPDAVAIAAPLETDELPPPTSEQLLPRPERHEPTPAELGAQKLASLELIARSIERLENERLAATRAGDSETARRNAIRIERLRRRGEQLEHELAGDPQDAAQDDR